MPSFNTTAKKYFKKQGKRALGYAKKRYLPKGQLNVKQIAKDVMLLKSVINAEKKRLDSGLLSTTTVAQYSDNTGSAPSNSGYVFEDITPTIAQGLTIKTRNGASVKLHSGLLNFQFVQQANCNGPTRIRIFIIKIKNAVITPSLSELQKIFDANPVTLFNDYNSLRNPDNFSDYQVLAKRNVFVNPDAGNSNVAMMKDLQIRLALKNHHLRYDQDSTTLRDGQIVMIAFADSGNKGSATTTTGWLGAAAPVTGPTSGVNIYRNYRWYYYDN